MLDVELPKNVLAQGPPALSPELIAMLDAELKVAQEKQRAVYQGELDSKAAAAAAKAGVLRGWTPPTNPDEASYLADGDLSLYTDEMVARRQRLQDHPGVQEVIQAWWAWLPKDKVEVEVVLSVEEQQARLAAEAEAEVARTKALGRSSPGPRSSSPGPGAAAAAPLGPPTRTETVVGLIKPVYCAMVVVVQLLLLPRYGLEPDPHYDPEDDWRDDSKGEDGPMTYPRFFDSMFQLADMWVESVVAWDYARLLADLLHDIQMHERESFLFSRVMQRFEYQPYYPDWLAEGPQFVPPKVLAEERDEQAEAEWEERLEREEQREYEAGLGGEGSGGDEEAEAEDEEEEGDEEEEEEDFLVKKRASGGAKRAMQAAFASPHPAAKAVGFGAVAARAAGRSPSPDPPSGRGSPSLWTAERRAKIMASAAAGAGAGRTFDIVAKLLVAHRPSPLSAAHVTAATAAAKAAPQPPGAGARALSGLQSMRLRFSTTSGAEPRKLAPVPVYIPSRPSRGSLYKVPAVPFRLRHRSPPGFRKHRPVPKLPLVPEEMYYILPRYVTYSDQLPDRMMRPHTAPEPLQPPPPPPPPPPARRPVAWAQLEQRLGQAGARDGALPQLRPSKQVQALSQTDPGAGASSLDRTVGQPWPSTGTRRLSQPLLLPDSSDADVDSLLGSPGSGALHPGLLCVVPGPYSSVSLPSSPVAADGTLGLCQADQAARQRTWSRVGRAAGGRASPTLGPVSPLHIPEQSAPGGRGAPGSSTLSTSRTECLTPGSASPYQGGGTSRANSVGLLWSQPAAHFTHGLSPDGLGMPMFYHHRTLTSRQGPPGRRASRPMV